jgi:hypothetical protein
MNTKTSPRMIYNFELRFLKETGMNALKEGILIDIKGLTGKEVTESWPGMMISGLFLRLMSTSLWWSSRKKTGKPKRGRQIKCIFHSNFHVILTSRETIDDDGDIPLQNMILLGTVESYDSGVHLHSFVPDDFLPPSSSMSVRNLICFCLLLFWWIIYRII